MMRGLAVCAVWLGLLNGVAAAPSDFYVDSCVKGTCCFPENERTEFKCKPDENGKYPCAVKLGVNSWGSSFGNVYIAKIYIEEVLGYPVEIEADINTYTGTQSETTIMDENGNVVVRSQWEELEEGLRDAILEIWPSNHEDNRFTYILERGTVQYGGLLGAIGKIGWFIPQFVIDEVDPMFGYWRTFADASKVTEFADRRSTATCCPSDIYSADNGIFPCMPRESLGGTPVANGGMTESSTCDDDPSKQIPNYGGRFLAGGMDWAQVDDVLIQNLGLNLTIEYAATEQNIRDIVKDHVDSKTPILFYYWTPSDFFLEVNLTEVSLPPYSKDCFGVDCGYPTETLYKVFSRSFRERNPQAAYFVEVFEYDSTKQQEELLGALGRGETPHDAACAWIGKYKSTTWKRWDSLVQKRFSVVEDYQYNSSVKMFVTSLGVLNMVVSGGFLVWTLLNRNHIVVKASQTKFLITIACGALISSSTIFTLTIDDSSDEAGISRLGQYEPATQGCRMAVWLYTTGFILTFGTLFAKTWRIGKIFNDKRLVRVTVPGSLLIGIIGTLLAIEVLLVSLWQINAPITYFRTPSVVDSYGNIVKSAGTCQGEGGNTYILMIFAYHIIILLYGNYLCYKSKNISTAFSESKYVQVAMLSNFQVLALGFPVLYIVAEDPVSSMFVRAGVIFLNDLTTQMFIFVPKIMAKMNGINTLEEALTSSSKTSVQPTAMTQQTTQAIN